MKVFLTGIFLSGLFLNYTHELDERWHLIHSTQDFSEVWQQSSLTINSEDTLRTGPETVAEVSIFGNGTMILSPNSEMIIGYTKKLTGESIEVQLNSGTVFIQMPDGNAQNLLLNTFETFAETNYAVFGVSSNGFYWVEEGELAVMAIRSGQNEQVGRGMYVQVIEDGGDIITGHLKARERIQLPPDVESYTVKRMSITLGGNN